MIPARLGSKRVVKKNLRLLNGKPLISYNIETAVKSNLFESVYVNSESNKFKAIAEKYGAKFYQRPKDLSLDTTNNDEFALDFIQKINSDIIIQILPTSPLLEIKELVAFVKYMLKNNLETLISVVEHQIAGIFNKNPINFKILEPHISSQEMKSIKTYATVLMGWESEKFKENMSTRGHAYHGGDGKIGYFPIKGLSTIDIDNEEDFRLAEVAIRMKSLNEFPTAEYFGENYNNVEVNVPEILKKDGVFKSHFESENIPLTHIKTLIEQYGNKSSWCHRLVNTENNSATLIAQMPGEGNRLHYHPNWNEWWYIFKGTWQWNVEGENVIVKEGDFVFIEKQKKHKITAVGKEMAIRLAVSRADVEHIYPEK